LLLIGVATYGVSERVGRAVADQRIARPKWFGADYHFTRITGGGVQEPLRVSTFGEYRRISRVKGALATGSQFVSLSGTDHPSKSEILPHQIYQPGNSPTEELQIVQGIREQRMSEGRISATRRPKKSSNLTVSLSNTAKNEVRLCHPAKQ
jgi:hypothetical protein